LFPLEGVGLQVERVQLTGVSGFGAIASECLQAWVRDVTGSQVMLHCIMHSIHAYSAYGVV
jgi:hypothetical protein